MRLSVSLCLAIVFSLPIFIHVPALLGFLAADPLYRSGGLGVAMPGILPGSATIDGNWAGIDQALTWRAMRTLFSGHLPWWNPFEGFGGPLAGEMQCSALFPFALLIALPNGPMILNTLLSAAAGIGMFLLLNRLRLGLWGALAGAVTFEMCGTFSWLSGAWSYAIPWLPFLVLGIELCRAESRITARAGIALVACSIALLLYAGFIETSYLEGLVGVLWAGVRLCTVPPSLRTIFAGRLIGATVLGLGLGSPIIVAFADMLSISAIGGHAGGFAGATLGAPAMIQKLMPYVYGPIFASKQEQIGYVWGGTGGYVGFALPVFALAGTFGRTRMIVRIICSVVVIFGIAAIFGGPLLNVLLMIPAMKFAALYRYVDPSISFALSILAALALDDLEKDYGRIRTRLIGALIVVTGITVIAFSLAAEQLYGTTAVSTDSGLLVWHSIAFAAVVCCANAIIFAVATRSRTSIVVSALTICLESIVFLIIPTLAAPRSATIDVRGVEYLQAHLGDQRFLSLGPLIPNYGSYFGIADIDYADLPAPKRTVDYIAKHLDPDADPISFSSGSRNEPAQTAMFARNVRAYADVGIKYVLLWPASPPPLRSLQPRFHDSIMAVYELPDVSPYFSAPGCTIERISRIAAGADCSSPSTLCRLELNAPGWTATVNGERTRPADCKEIFQSVALPAGHSTIAFDFLPPHMELAFIAFAIALPITLTLLYRTLASMRRARMRRARASTPAL